MTEGLALRHISVHFGGLTALDDISLDVPPGAVVGVIGPNGAGKTTLFNVVCGFVRPETGTMTLDGQPLRPRPQQLTRLGIARTLQGIGQFSGLTVLENVMAGAGRDARTGVLSALFSMPRTDRDEHRLRDAAMSALRTCGVAEYAAARPDGLPYAVRKRVGLARALVARPRILLLDEPAGGLGAQEIDELATLISGLHCSVLVVEHHMDLVMSICDRILVLDFGKQVAIGTPTEVSADPAVAEAYLGADAGQPQ
ncbi:ABC transporter ATP-binding protein [Mangrovihabitans endophyticus]|uniref:ABC transporter ATP-binding protein n=1 Tax=Mangrovihabitans endophyticus TaxID=1751298 RepID=A0A8J3FS17_9ACTN|nr:ABC transporter ATP-binding protein [Mangrovihabitans endophyticus]GGL20758.1 ABC transporter ATP-binding protein [Mangrovihabitans endophyticus]